MIEFHTEGITLTEQEYEKFGINVGPMEALFSPRPTEQKDSQVPFILDEVVHCSPRLAFWKHVEKGSRVSLYHQNHRLLFIFLFHAPLTQNGLPFPSSGS